MADGRETKSELSEREARAESPPLTAEQFVATPDFQRFKKGMRKIVKVSKAELDERIRLAKARSYRSVDPNSPGRKPKAKQGKDG